MNLLALIGEAAIELNLMPPVSVIASTNPQIRLLRRLASQEGKSLAGRHNWQALLTEKTFATTAAAAQTSSIPTDFDRMVPETMFNRTTNRRVSGPVDENTWQSIQSALVIFVNPAFRIMGNTILFTPTPAASQTVAYEYVSNLWCLDNMSVGHADWTADTDTYKLNDESMILGIVWRFKKSKGFAWNDDFLVYERYVGDLIVRDGSRTRIYTDQPNWNRKPTPPQVPETLSFA